MKTLEEEDVESQYMNTRRKSMKISCCVNEVRWKSTPSSG